MILLALALAPVIAIIWYFLFLDRFNKEPLKMLFLTFVFGLISTAPAILLELGGLEILGDENKGTILHTWLKAFIVIALSEELAKYFFLRKYVYGSAHFDEPFDGIIYALMISMGFAALENVIYVLQGGFQVAFMRMITAVPAHATFAVLMGYWVGLAKMTGRPVLNWLGLFSAVLFHGLYDFFLIEHLFYGQVFGAILSLIVGMILARSAIRIHRLGGAKIAIKDSGGGR